MPSKMTRQSGAFRLRKQAAIKPVSPIKSIRGGVNQRLAG